MSLSQRLNKIFTNLSHHFTDTDTGLKRLSLFLKVIQTINVWYSQSFNTNLSPSKSQYSKAKVTLRNSHSFLFFKILFIYPWKTCRERQRHRQREKQAPCREPNVGLHPRDHTLSWRQMLNRLATQVTQHESLSVFTLHMFLHAFALLTAPIFWNTFDSCFYLSPHIPPTFLRSSY